VQENWELSDTPNTTSPNLSVVTSNAIMMITERSIFNQNTWACLLYVLRWPMLRHGKQSTSSQKWQHCYVERYEEILCDVRGTGICCDAMYTSLVPSPSWFLV